MDDAVIVGASVSGLAAAAVLSERFARVLVLDRQQSPERGAIASLAPQARMPHVLLGGGLAALERVQPDFVQRAQELGATLRDHDASGRWWAGGYARHGGPTGVRGLFGSRELLETALRDCIRQRPNVTLVGGAKADGIDVQRGRVVGVRSESGAVGADLVVDASGRHTPFPRWLLEAGLEAPATTEVGVHLAYTGVRVRSAATDGDFAVVQASRSLARMGVGLRAEGGTWQVALAGYFGDDPGITHESVRAFARSLPDPSVAAVLDADWLGPPSRYRFPASLRRHYERLRHQPQGLVAVGDAVASFNPCYGQGMTSGVLQAEALGRALDAGPITTLPRRVAEACAQVVDGPWQIAAGGDFIHQGTVGTRPRGTALSNRYLDRVFRACATDPEVNRALYRVQHLLAPPTTLLHPKIALRVVRAQRPS